jgi:hypothetical protein
VPRIFLSLIRMLRSIRAEAVTVPKLCTASRDAKDPQPLRAAGRILRTKQGDDVIIGPPSLLLLALPFESTGCIDGRGGSGR